LRKTALAKKNIMMHRAALNGSGLMQTMEGRH